MPELRVELEKFIVDVMDGYCSGTGMCRTKLANQILGDWAHQKHHESIVILRVAGGNPDRSEKQS
jgi:hypothetical protein